MSKATITCSTPDAVIRYTTDKTDPTESSPVYTQPVDFTDEIRAKAWKDGMESSDIAVAVAQEEDEMAYYRNEIQLTNVTVDPSYSFDCNVSSEDYNRLITGRYDCFLIMKMSSDPLTLCMKLVPVMSQFNIQSNNNIVAMSFALGSYKANIMMTNNHATFSNDYEEIFSDFMMYTQVGYGGTAYLVIQGYEPAS